MFKFPKIHFLKILNKTKKIYVKHKLSVRCVCMGNHLKEELSQWQQSLLRREFPLCTKIFQHFVEIKVNNTENVTPISVSRM